MTIDAGHSEKKYRKEILLPRPVSDKNVAISCNNGIVEIRCELNERR